jgi:hypothetical protein
MCAICKRGLVESSKGEDDKSIVGEECHIISGKCNGPRYDHNYSAKDIDSYQNLILLCCTDHKMVDDQPNTYTSNILKQIKTNHENWVKNTFKSTNKSDSVRIKRIKKNIPTSFYRFSSGKEIIDIFNHCYVMYTYHDELETQEEVKDVGEFLQSLQDWLDINSELDVKDHIRFGFDLNQVLKDLEKLGFYVFGAKEIQIIEGGVGEPSPWPVVYIRVLRKTNPDIITVTNDINNGKGNKK